MFFSDCQVRSWMNHAETLKLNTHKYAYYYLLCFYYDLYILRMTTHQHLPHSKVWPREAKPCMYREDADVCQ